MAHKKKKPSPNAIVHDGPAVWAGGDSKWRAEEDHRTLTRAGEIKADKDRMKAAKDHHKKQNKHMDKACK